MPTAPISLYIDLEPGQTAELENVAQASLAFAAGIREVAYLFDPSFEFRIELQRGDEGSLWLKARLRWIRGLGHANPTLRAVTYAALAWFAAETGSYTYAKVLDYFLSSDDPVIQELSPEQAEQLARRIVELSASDAPSEHFRGVYRALSNDPAVRGIGAATTHAQPPAYIVPSTEFAARGSAVAPVPEVGETRTVRTSGDFVIIKPVLKDSKGKWRLRGRHGEFSADTLMTPSMTTFWPVRSVFLWPPKST